MHWNDRHWELLGFNAAGYVLCCKFNCVIHCILQAKAIMTEWLRNHQDNPYPNDDEKEALMQSTKLTINQINYWFTNARRRLLPKWSMIRRNAEEARNSCSSPIMTTWIKYSLDHCPWENCRYCPLYSYSACVVLYMYFYTRYIFCRVLVYVYKQYYLFSITAGLFQASHCIALIADFVDMVCPVATVCAFVDRVISYINYWLTGFCIRHTKQNVNWSRHLCVCVCV